MRTKRVLHIIDSFGAGGAETWLLATVKYLKANPNLNLQFDFLATSGEVSLFDEEIREQGCKIFYVKYSFRSLSSFRANLKSILLSNQYDAIHTVSVNFGDINQSSSFKYSCAFCFPAGSSR